ncbi:MAG TPA: 50S ribosomal protein L10 [Bryobacteraceae bacterium]|nr:50S ribosomal protein L10 [Bryobacteraceae bacterium]
MKKKADKRKDGEKMRDGLLQSPHMFVAGFEKLTVSQDYELRKAIRNAGGGYEVVKNTIAEKASKGTSAERLLTGLRGMTSIAFTSGDPVGLAKALTTYAKTHPNFTFKAGMVEGHAIDVAAIQDLASLPSREVVLSKLLFLINATAQRLVTAINGVGRNVAVVIDQGVKENKFQS